MEKYHGNTVEYWKQNAEENYLTTPINVLKYITVLEEQAEQLRKNVVSNSLCQDCGQHPISPDAITLCDRCLTKAYYSK